MARRGRPQIQRRPQWPQQPRQAVQSSDGRSTIRLGRDSANYKKLRRLFRAQCARTQAPCWLCRQPIDYQLPFGEPDAYSTDHVKPVSLHPELAEEISNFRPSHQRCNSSRGNRDVLDLGTPSRNW